MKILLPFIAAICLGCSSRASEPILEVENQSTESIAEVRKDVAATSYTIETATRLNFEKAKKNNPEAFTADTANFRKENGVLSLQLKDEWKLLTSFRDTLNAPETDDTDIREYKYLGQLKPINKYVVGGYFWEFYECYLVDKVTGKVDTTWTSPSLSPDNRLLASLSLPYGLEGLPNGIQIFKVENSGKQITKYFEINQDEWSPYESYWESNDSIIIKMLPIGRVLEINGIPKEEDFSYLRLKIK